MTAPQRVGRQRSGHCGPLRDPAVALRKWIELLKPTGMLILIEGRWNTGVGLTADECVRLVNELRNDVTLRVLDDPSYWGGPTSDERYLIVSRS